MTCAEAAFIVLTTMPAIPDWVALSVAAAVMILGLYHALKERDGIPAHPLKNDSSRSDASQK
jgi:hypothetical protein